MMNFDELFNEVRDEEGFVSHVYKDHLGYFTIGHGIMVDQVRGGGLTEEESEYIVRGRLAKIAVRLAREIDSFPDLPETVQRVLVNMAYQLGVSGLLTFEKMIAYLNAGDFEMAAHEALNSKWAKLDTPDRAKRLAAKIREA